MSVTEPSFEGYSTLTCPECGHQSKDLMPTNACQFFYDCKGCSKILRPNAADCCVYCSYGDVKCPPVVWNGVLLGLFLVSYVVNIGYSRAWKKRPAAVSAVVFAGIALFGYVNARVSHPGVPMMLAMTNAIPKCEKTYSSHSQTIRVNKFVSTLRAVT